MKLKLILIIVLCGCVTFVSAKKTHVRNNRNKEVKDDTLLVKSYMDSLMVYKRMADSLSRVNDSLMTERKPDSRYFRLFAPLTFYNNVAGSRLSLEGANGEDDADEVVKGIDQALLAMYLRHPEYVSNTENQVEKVGELHEEIKTPIRNKVEFSEPSVPVPEDVPTTPVDIVVKKPNFWTYSGEYYMQFLQNYISSNWYKGGESNYSMVASAIFQANYNNKQKVKFENKLELKLGFQTTKGDSLHSLKTSEDLIRYTGKLGLQATKNWYYTLQLIAYTQFMRGYKSNDPDVYSDILSPLNTNLSIGMSYTVKALKGKLTGSVQLSPVAYNFRYVGRKALATQYGLEEGEQTMHDIGSECTVDLTWAFTSDIKWKTRFYAYTTYKRTELEWENTITFSINRYLSSNIFIYPRFDDSSTKDDKYGYFQLKEYASLGFSYSF
ncbi:MAG: DUF3078 domain-containing protein [Prevotellaceae bacterium]|nr:DUF3078 domain-containing protein [Prevotellaceae bacterium]